MSKKKVSGLAGTLVGGVWLAINFRHFDEQGFVAIGMPLIILIAGMFFFFSGSEAS